MTAEELRILRAKYKVSNRDIADDIGVNHVTISRWAQGSKPISKLGEIALINYFKTKEIKEVV